jgi:hypothetical protein
MVLEQQYIIGLYPPLVGAFVSSSCNSVVTGLMSALLGHIAVFAGERAVGYQHYYVPHVHGTRTSFHSSCSQLSRAISSGHDIEWYSGISDAVSLHHKQGKQTPSKAQKDECHVHKYV